MSDLPSDTAEAGKRLVDAVTLARRFHETYERLAPEFGYETRPESAVSWDDVPPANRALMIAVALEVTAAEPATAPRPAVYVDPAVHSGDPCVNGHRVPTRFVAEMVLGSGVEGAAFAYDLTVPEVLVACWYEARHGSKRFRRLWRGWLAMVEGQMWEGKWDNIGYPETKP